jgi:uncharacterized membrane protein (DUF4010 family)
MDAGALAVRLGAALAAGALAGVERGWSLRDQAEGTRVAGVRTIALIGLAGGLAGIVATQGHIGTGAVLAAGAAAIIALGYGATVRDRPDATSAVTAILVLAIGFLAGIGIVGPALGAAALTVLILALRDPLHGFVGRLDAGDVKALARFAVIALAVLPVLPDRAMGPYLAWNPARLWLVVVIVTGFSFAGYVANRVFGARHGTLAIAVIGGAYSSTAVTQSLSQRLRAVGIDSAATAGIALASTVMYVRILVLVTLLAPRLLAPFALLTAPALMTQAAASALLYRRVDGNDHLAPPGNPIALLPAIGFMAVVALAAVAARWAQVRFGSGGIAVTLFLIGAADVDASIVTAGGLPASAIGDALAAFAVAGTVIANMLLKIAVVVGYAGRRGTPAAAAMGASTLVLAATLLGAWLAFGRG